MSLARPIRITLFASILLNVMLLTAGGLWWLGQRDALPADPEPRTGQQESDRERFRAAMAPHREQMRERLEAVRAARAEVGAALREPELDAERLRDALATLRAAEAVAAEDSHRLLADFAASLDADGRERMATRMEQRRGGRGVRVMHLRRGDAPER